MTEVNQNEEIIDPDKYDILAIDDSDRELFELYKTTCELQLSNKVNYIKTYLTAYHMRKDLDSDSI